MTKILDRLADALPDLPTKLARAARFAVDNPERIALSSMRTAAAECEVASPTMLRLARQMGFSSYDDFKSEFQAVVLSPGFGSRASALLSDQEDGSALVDQISRACTENISRSLHRVEPATLSAMAEALRAAKTIYVVGAGMMHWAAAMMQTSGRMALPNLRVPHTNAPSIVETLGAIGPDDVLLTLTVAPYARSTVEAAAFAKDRGAKVLAISNKRSSPLLELSEHSIIVDTDSPHYYPSIVAIIAAIEALLATVVAQSDEATLRRIKMIEDLRRRSGAYLE